MASLHRLSWLSLFSLLLLVAFLKPTWASDPEIYMVTFKDGESVSGLIVHIDSEEIHIQTAKDQVIHRKFREVLSMKPLSEGQVDEPVESFHGAFSLSGGVKNLRRSDYYPAHRTMEAGISAEAGKEGWPVLASTGVLYSTGHGHTDGDSFSVKSLEASLGAVKHFRIFRTVNPFLGAGAAYFRVDSEQKGAVDEKKSRARLGTYLETGLRAALWEKGFLGVGFRYSLAQASYETGHGGHDARLGGVHITGLLGYEW
jgi:opacity protein-like surface antigen